MLSDIGVLRTQYTSDTDDIALEFYDPCLRESVRYDRITGFFSSTVFHLMQPGLEAFFLSHDGVIRMLCSPRLSAADADSLAYGYDARDDAELVEALTGELTQLLNSTHANTTRLLACLVATGRLDIRLAKVNSRVGTDNQRMFHDKVGLFVDDSGNAVGFRGSMNETYLGLAPDGNVESIDVWPSWEGGRDAIRVSHALARFERLWDGVVPGVAVIGLPNEITNELDRIAHDSDLEALLRDLAHRRSASDTETGYAVGGIKLREHQCCAIQQWIANQHRGLFAHATGSGKTITGLYAAQEALDAGLTPVILVPSRLLLDQWADQVREHLGTKVLLVGSGHDHWSRGGALRAAIESQRRYVVVAVLNSATQPAFRAQVRPVANRVFLLADEAHRLGSRSFSGILDWLDASWRLGLSATPERANDPDGTKAIFDYFGGIIHQYTLKDALDDQVLAPYAYYPSWVGLSEHEQRRWNELTSEIRRRYAISRSETTDASHFEEQLQRKLIERARIAKGAERKAGHAAEIMQRHYRPREKQKWLVYCDNRDQMADVRAALDAVGVRSWEYHSKMEGDPQATLRLFDVSGGVIVAIKCLDEGVDIPSASHALILASSRNPREFVQRRGRILRRSPNKTVATLMDVLVLPDSVDRSDPSWPLVVGELSRAYQFAAWAIGDGATSELEQKWMSMGLPLTQMDGLSAAGIEDDMTEEGENGVA